MSYRRAMAYLDSLDFRGMRLGLANTERLLGELGSPERDFEVIHVAGTNGKGSTAALISNILTKAGIKNGLYTSPHLESFRERIQMNGKMISRAQAEDLIEEVRKVADSLADTQPTYFEFMTAMAFQHFARQKAAAAVVEVGMGGRFDSTNVVDPAVSVITSVAMDHRRHLGSSLRAIAREKCGIIKRGRPVVTGVRDNDVASVIGETARQRRAALFGIRKGYAVRRLALAERGEMFDFHSPKGDFHGVKVSLAGRRQVDNAAAAIMSALLLRERGFRIDEGAIRAGLSDIVLPGRFELFRERPAVILDGAHNTKAASALRATLLERYGGKKVNIVFGAMFDKDYKRMLRTLRPAAKSFHIYRPDVPRAAKLDDMLAAQRDRAIPTRALGGPEDVLRLIEKAKMDDVLVVTGSFYTVGEIRAHLGRTFSGGRAAD